MARIFVPTSSLSRDVEVTRDFARRSERYRTVGTKVDCFNVDPPVIDESGYVADFEHALTVEAALFLEIKHLWVVTNWE